MPKVVGEMVLELAALDEEAAKETWYPLSSKKTVTLLLFGYEM